MESQNNSDQSQNDGDQSGAGSSGQSSGGGEQLFTKVGTGSEGKFPVLVRPCKSVTFHYFLMISILFHLISNEL